MPIKYKQEDGTEIEVFTQEELDAAKTGAIEEYKEANPVQEKTEEPKPQPQNNSGDDPIAKLAQDLESVKAQLASERLSGFARKFAGDDAERQSAYTAAYNRLTGYEETPEGAAQRAADAAKLAFGSDVPAFDVSSVVATVAGGPNGDKKPAQTEADTKIQSMLGITPQDVEKYGKEGGEAKTN